MERLRKEANDQGMLLDDFVEASYTYRRLRHVLDRPWVGMFHHPVNINSPILNDRTTAVRNLLARDSRFKAACKKLRGAIVFSPDVADEIRAWLKVPVLLIKHPTELAVHQWTGGDDLWQVGFYLRNTRMLHTMPVAPGAMQRRFRSQPYLNWHLSRDKKLAAYYAKQNNHAEVLEIERMYDADYDDALQSSIVCNQLYGAAANNVVLECIARATPILVNRLPGVEYYLGKDYPLFYKDLEQAAFWSADEHRVIEAHAYLRELKKNDLSLDYFISNVMEFVNGQKC